MGRCLFDMKMRKETDHIKIGIKETMSAILFQRSFRHDASVPLQRS